ncbi:MAG TPA: hypothetical protein VI461_08075 [Chitinophagaceae bacterium]|nr:hypothetical protein [Chitinophagaceae bacterium]
MITEQGYLDAEEQYINLTEEELGQLAREAAEAQPALFVFIATYYELLEEEENKHFFVQMVYSTWLAYKNKYELKRKLSIEEIEKMEEKEDKRLNELYQNQDEIINEALQRMTQHPQSELIGYLYTQIGDYFGIEELDDDDSDDPAYRDAGLISGVINAYVNLLEKARQPMYIL